jgi:hypothetical protein
VKYWVVAAARKKEEVRAYLGLVWIGAPAATPRHTCGAQNERHTGGVGSVAGGGGLGGHPNIPLVCD